MKNLFLLLMIGLVSFIILCPIFLPAKIEVKTNREFAYPSNLIFEEFNHLKKFSQWNIFSKKSEKIELIFFQPYIGENALMKWEINDNLFANGQIQIKKSIEHSLIEMSVLLPKIGVELKNLIVFNETPNHKSFLAISFLEKGDSTYFGRYINFFFNYFLQKEVNKNLDKLEIILNQKEKRRNKSFSLSSGNVLMKEYIGRKYIGVKISTSAELKDQLYSINEALQTIENTLIKSKINQNSLSLIPVVYFNSNDTINNKSDFWVGITYSEKLQNLKYPIKSNKTLLDKDSIKKEPLHKLQLFSIPSNKTAITIHQGKFTEIKNSYRLIDKYLRLSKFMPKTTKWYELNELKLDSINEVELKVFVPVY